MHKTQNKMDHTKQMENSCKTPTKKLITFHGLLTQQSANKTPPSCPTKVKNPFEHVLHEHLGSNFISPTLFAKKTPVKKDFSWTIDELSVLKPAEIDEHSSNQFESPEREELDAMVQSRIESYFSMKQILPSPMQPHEGVPLIMEAMSPPSASCSSTTSTAVSAVFTASSYAQTVLSLPPSLPDKLQRLLQPYFSYTECQANQHGNNDQRLYTELFDSPTTPCVDSEKRSLHAEHEQSDEDIFDSPVKISPRYTHSSLYQRTIGTPGNYSEINDCPLSPICLSAEQDLQDDEEQHSSRIMSIDGSFNVPDCSHVEKHQMSQLDSSQHSSEGLNTSTMNWDLEYKQVSSPLPPAGIETMEVSRLNTPKQRHIHSQRKKLSDSFGADVDGDDEDYMIVSQQSSRADENGESGYQTNPSFELLTPAGHYFAQPGPSKDNARLESTSLWESVDVVSSTPTKRKSGRLLFADEATKYTPGQLSVALSSPSVAQS